MFIALAWTSGGFGPTGDVARADTAPSVGTPATVTADALPTVQIDGVVWKQLVVNGTVFAGGRFANARPAGAAPGENLQPRSNLLSYDLATGVLKPFNPTFNGQIRALAASPDGKTLYVGGEFTMVGTTPRNRVAAFDIATGKLLADIANVNAGVLGLAATATRVYVVGYFSSINNVRRIGAAAVDRKTGTVQPFTVTPSGGDVRQVVVSPDGKKVVLGGSFDLTNGSSSPGRGLAMLDATTSALLPLPVNTTVRNGGTDSAILSLAGDANGFYGGGYTFGPQVGNFEGAFRADWNGKLSWMEDCHGDTYSVAGLADQFFVAGHPHECNTVGGFPRTEPWTHQHGLAFTAKATQKVGPTPHNYNNFEGKPAPSPLHWYPRFQIGTFTGLNQAAWSVVATADYVAYAGEFPSVNGTPQQGIVRFAVPRLAPKKQGPVVGKPNALTATAQSSSVIRLSWSAGSDPDNERLGYQLFRSRAGVAPGPETLVYEANAKTTFWRQPILSYRDIGLVADQQYDYRLRIYDPNGNQTSVTTSGRTAASGGSTLTAYQQLVLTDGPTSYWPLDSISGGLSPDLISGNDLYVLAGVTPSTTGAITGDKRAAIDLTPAAPPTGLQGSQVDDAPMDFTTEAWFKTTSTTGGTVTGYVDPTNQDSDRLIYLTRTGKVRLTVAPQRRTRTIVSSKAYNDGRWHHVAATLSANGLALYLDGVKIGSLSGARTGRYLQVTSVRVGTANLQGLPDRPLTDTLTGAVDELALYPVPLSGSQIAEHYKRGIGQAVDPRPFVSDGFTTTSTRGLAWSAVGGPWRVSDPARVTAASGKAVLNLSTPGANHSAYQGAANRTDLQTAFTTDRASTGSGVYVKPEVRRIDAKNAYRANIRVAANNEVRYFIEGLKGGTEVALTKTVRMAGTYKPGQYVNVRMQAYGTGPSTLRVKVWLASTKEPTSWGLTVQDSAAALQGFGQVGISAISSKASDKKKPVKVKVERVVARPVP